jgi:hypothetical protein
VTSLPRRAAMPGSRRSTYNGQSSDKLLTDDQYTLVALIPGLGCSPSEPTLTVVLAHRTDDPK